MGDEMMEATVKIRAGHMAWLEQMAKDHQLPDANKALRVLLEYAVQEGDVEAIFKQVRCHHCG